MNVKRIILFFAAALGLLTSCVENLNEPNDVNNLLSGVEAQVEAMQKSAEDMKALNEALGECGVDVADAEKAISQHLASIKKGASLETATLATLELQKKIAAVVGAAEGAVLFEEGYAKNFKKLFEDVNNGVAMWLGESFSAYYQVTVAQAKIDFVLGDLNPQIEEQQLYVDALVSDVEAGLREDENPEELAALAVSVEKMSQKSESLANGLASMAQDLENEYKSAFSSEPGSFDSEALVELNKTAMTKANDATPTLVDLAASVKQCATDLEALKSRLGEVEATIGELLGMIQSLTFVSEYSDDKAVAYYSMTDDINQERYAEGKKNRVPAKTFDLTFLVRPAAVADALAQTWQESLAVVGYYANRIEQQATANIQSFEIVNAVSTTGKGLLTVTVNNAFDDDFYFKEKGAMLALAVESGKNNCASKFIEIVPRDISGKVYAESLVLEPTSLSVQNGGTYQLKAIISPSNVTDEGVEWNNYDAGAFSVNENGLLTAKAVGNGIVEVTAKATDEYGRKLTATCDVTVTPSIRVNGPSSVELAQTIELELESPTYIDPKWVTWQVYPLDKAYLSLTPSGTKCSVTCNMMKFLDEIIYNTDKDGKVTSVNLGKKYNEVEVVCTVENVGTIVHKVTPIARQPRSIEIVGVGTNQNSLVVKVGETKTFEASILPSDVNTGQDGFKLNYQSHNSGVAQIDFFSGNMQAVHIGAADIVFLVGVRDENIYWPSDATFKRTLKVVVEPYWVKTMTLPASYKMAPDATAAITPEWTSDVDGVAPSDQKLVWTSDNPSVVSVNETTGEMVAHKEGTATITATTAGSNAVPSGSNQISSSCLVTVEVPTVPVNVGDFYYSDGTWSTARDNSKTVIGIVFANVDATASDLNLRAADGNFNHGLVVGLSEYMSIKGYHTSDDTSNNSTAKYYNSNGWPSTPLNDNDQVILGYTHTLALSAYRAWKGSDWVKYISVIDNLSAPEGGSSWYVPSFAEMKLIDANIDLINQRLRAVSGTQIQVEGKYWVSTMMKRNKYTDLISMPFDMSKGTWVDSGSSSDYLSNTSSTELPIRVVFAF